MEWSNTQQVTQIGSAKEEEFAITPAMFPNPEGEQPGHCKSSDLHVHRREGEHWPGSTTIEGSTGRIGTAKAEPNRPATAETLFEPYHHPEAASSDGRERKWMAVGKVRCSRSLKDKKEKENPPPNNFAKCKRRNAAKLQKRRPSPNMCQGRLGR